eukprot:Ihof_evm5s175 gene=Ihof_evmTU5s175
MTVKKQNKETWLLVPATTLNNRQFEFSIHRVPPRMVTELRNVFLNVDLNNLLVVPTFQKTNIDLTSIGQPIEKIKDECLETFYQWGGQICQRLNKKGFWADMADPSSGYPMIGAQGPSFYPEVLGGQIILGYDLTSTGCCK